MEGIHIIQRSTIFLTQSANEFKDKNWARMIDEFRILEVCLGINT